MATFNLEEHLKVEHKRTAFSEYLREIVYGGNDGIVTTFAVVAGFAGAQKDPVSSAIPAVSVLLFGLANLFADAFSMSLGSFLSHRADQDIYRTEKSKEAHEILHDPDSEFSETIEILKRKKFSHKDATTLATIYRSNPHYWTEFMMKDELEMTDPEKENPYFVALFTFFSFVVFGGIPLSPYIFGFSNNTFTLSIGFTALALLLLGILRAYISKQKPLRGILETLLVGGLSASVAYIVGTFFRI
ncbi:VIT1/CCC1 transporter family protein [Patescibacteria group bacterium]|nr:VIT1/CCC1 transporter family protein [Patescibacteria group bacterium]